MGSAIQNSENHQINGVHTEFLSMKAIRPDYGPIQRQNPSCSDIKFL
jgi:hypothetical protein